MRLLNLVYLVHVDCTNSPPLPHVDLRGLFMKPLSPPSGPHGLRMPPKVNMVGVCIFFVTNIFSSLWKKQYLDFYSLVSNYVNE